MMNAEQYLRTLYDRLGWPDLANFALVDLSPETDYAFGAFVLADHGGEAILIRRTPIKQYPGIENHWWIPGGAQEDSESLDQTAIRELHEETCLTCTIERTLLAQLADDRPFIAVFFRGQVQRGAASPDSDPDSATAEAELFPTGSVPYELLWTDSDKILLTRGGFTSGPVEDLITKNGLRKHNTNQNRISKGRGRPSEHA